MLASLGSKKTRLLLKPDTCLKSFGSLIDGIGSFFGSVLPKKKPLILDKVDSNLLDPSASVSLVSVMLGNSTAMFGASFEGEFRSTCSFNLHASSANEKLRPAL